ncbi:hypothetical protein EV182_002981 [Spiromyces aspiralis]|uniref:Uncharacterized protein n=1 Tax=Spiromyces aspiralis TaxID=68401 RepID=A0ACC1HEG6_9FUNG|nr:hypothetical protein EV182_002981 [Spiromyces aspiralis]
MVEQEMTGEEEKSAKFVVLNESRKEYVVTNRRDFTKVISSLICWSDDPSASMRTNHDITKGRWAWNRISILSLDEFEPVAAECKDITERVYRHVKKIAGNFAPMVRGRHVSVHNAKGMRAEEEMQKHSPRARALMSDDAALPNNRLRSTTTSSTGSNRAPARVTGDVVSVGTTDWIRLVRDNKHLVDKTDLLLDIMKYDSSANRLVSGVGGRQVLIDLLLSGEYPKFIKHVEHALEAQNQMVTAETHGTFYRMFLSMMLSVFLDSSKYDVTREVATNQGRADIVVKPRFGAANGSSGRGPVGVLIEVKRANPKTVDKDAPSLTADDIRFIEDGSKDRTERARKKLGDKTFESLTGLLAEGYDQTRKNKYLDTLYGYCDEALVVIASFSGKRCLFQFECFKYLVGTWCLDTENHPIVDDLACPYNWPGL